MLVCPVCEHRQPQGSRCEVCDKELVVTPALKLPTQVVDGLEANVVPRARAEAPALAELELNAHKKGQQYPILPLDELIEDRPERGAIPVQPMGEMDSGRAAPVANTPAPSGAITCRYCQHVQSAGLLCERCGMRLSKARSSEAASAKKIPAATVWTRCRHCGAPAKGGERCGDCGRDVAMPT